MAWKRARKFCQRGLVTLLNGGRRVVRLFDALFGEQAAILAERHENNAVEYDLCDANCFLDWLGVLASQVFDQPPTLLTVTLVKFIADHALTLRRAIQQLERPRLPVNGRQQPAELQQIIKLKEFFFDVQLGKPKLLEGQRCFVAMVQPRGDKIADNAPGAFGERIEVVPTLLHRSPAIELIPVQVGGSTLQFDHGDGRAAGSWSKLAQGPIGRADARHRKIPLQVVFVGERVAGE